jgi:hypothetical protein
VALGNYDYSAGMVVNGMVNIIDSIGGVYSVISHSQRIVVSLDTKRRRQRPRPARLR